MADHSVSKDGNQRGNEIAVLTQSVNKVFFLIPAKGDAVQLADTDPVAGQLLSDTKDLVKRFARHAWYLF